MAIGSAGSETHGVLYQLQRPQRAADRHPDRRRNETMVASWDAVDGADGYRITIYDAAGNDTGLGYEYSTEQFQETLNGAANPDYMPGLKIENGTYTIDMAMTVGDPVAEDAEGNSLKLSQIGTTRWASRRTKLTPPLQSAKTRMAPPSPRT